MTDQKEFEALVVEKESQVAQFVADALKKRSYAVTNLAQKEEAKSTLKEKHYDLAVVGEAEDAASVFGTLKEVVMTSPFTSVILVTDAPEEEVHEKAEGYGILGSVKRSASESDLMQLVDRFEDIAKSMPPPKG